MGGSGQDRLEGGGGEGRGRNWSEACGWVCKGHAAVEEGKKAFWEAVVEAESKDEEEGWVRSRGRGGGEIRTNITVGRRINERRGGWDKG